MLFDCWLRSCGFSLIFVGQEHDGSPTDIADGGDAFI
jgi:hypothetical protein